MPRDLFSPELLEAIRTNTYTQEALNLSTEKLSDADLTDLVTALESNTHIKSLDVRYCGIGPTGSHILARTTTLTTLNLSNNKIGSEGIQAFALHKTLTTLDVSKNGICGGMQDFTDNEILITLNISDNQIGPEEAKSLAKNKSLRTLYAANNRMGSEGAQAFVENETLTTLDISHNGIAREGAELAKNRTLTTLDMSRNNLSLKGAEAFLSNSTLIKLELRDHVITPSMEQKLNNLLNKRHYQNQTRIKERKQLARATLVTLAASFRAMRGTDRFLNNSILPLTKIINDFAGFHSTATPTKSIDTFMHTPFFSSMVNEIREEEKEAEEKGEEKSAAAPSWHS